MEPKVFLSASGSLPTTVVTPSSSSASGATVPASSSSSSSSPPVSGLSLPHSPFIALSALSTALSTPIAATATPTAAASLASSLQQSPSSRLSQLRLAASHWRSVDLDSRRSTLDSQALVIVDEDTRAVVARKSLAESTKAFKRSPETEQLTAIGPLLKSYQEEINALTKRAKSSEVTFLTLYKQLIDAPDPAATLQSAVQDIERMSLVEDQLSATRSQLAAYEIEFNGLKSQDVTVRRLEAENREILAQLDQKVAAAAEQRAAEVRAELTEVRKNANEKEKQLQQRIDILKEQLQQVKSEASDHHAQALSVDQMLERELEKMHAEVGRKDAEIEDLRRQLNLAQGSTTTAPASHNINTSYSSSSSSQSNHEIIRLEEELTETHKQIQVYESQSRDQQSKLETMTRTLAQARLDQTQNDDRYNTIITNLRAEMSSLPTKLEYDELKKQLKFLQEMEYSVIDEHETSALPSTPSSSSSETTLLLSKTRRLETELTRLKLRNVELETLSQKTREECDILQRELMKVKELNRKLEEDLVQSNSKMVKNLVGGLQQQQTPSSRSLDSPSTTTPSTTATTANPLTVDTSTSSDASLQSQLAQSASMLTIVLQQRDRYRSRIDTLESQTQSLTVQLEKIKQENGVLKQDNIKLYEKMQFVKSMSGGSSASTSSAASSSSSSIGDIETGIGGNNSSSSSRSVNAEQKYAALYEARLNPFDAFRAKSKQAREAALSMSERITLMVGRALFSKKLARNFLFGYALVLHLLVMVVLWTHTVRSHCATATPGEHDH